MAHQLAAYTFNEGSGTTAAEVSGGTTLTGIPGWSASGVHGSAMEVVGWGPLADPYATGTNFTIMLDFYIIGDGASGLNMLVREPTFGAVQLGTSGSAQWYANVGSNIDAFYTFTYATWYNIAFTADGTTRRVYVNGTEVGSVANPNTIGTDSIRIGGHDDGATYAANVRMDNLRFFDEALSAAQIASLAGTEAAVEPLEADIADNIGITDSLTVIGPPVLYEVDLADSVAILDTEDPMTLSVTEFLDDGVGVSDAASTSDNALPTANAGADQTVATGELVTLDGSAVDSDGIITTWTWVQVSGPTAVLSGSGSTRTFTPTTTGTYVFGLTVTDDGGFTSTQDTVTVAVFTTQDLLDRLGYVSYIVVQL